MFNKALKATAAALLLTLGAAHAATVGAPVTIQEGSVPGSASNLVVVDQLSGQYDEVFTATSASTFVTEAIFEAGGWFRNSASIPTQVNAFGEGGYRLYAKFSSAGTFSAAGGGVTFTGGSGLIELWVDPLMNTNYDVKGSATGNVNNLNLTSGAASVTDDFKLGFATSLLAGEGQATGGLANGNFELVFGNFELTSPQGEAYFVAPRPFYLVLDINGNFQSFSPVSGQSVQLLNNSANAFFMPVPEPGALALVGIALAGMGVARRRKAA